MSAPARYLAIDLGAESGRGVVGVIDHGRLQIEEIHRFPNRVIRLGRSLHWNVYALWEEILEALGRAARSGEVPTVGVDTWGVDFGLLAADGTLLGLPHTYRDPRTEGAIESMAARLPLAEIYRRTGVQILPLNTAFQLHAMTAAGSPLLDVAADLVFMPDLFHFWLTGRKATEFTFATTSQLYNPLAGTWDDVLLAAAGVGRSLLQEIVSPGTMLGRLTAAVVEQTGCRAQVCAVGTHDTASAVAAVPAVDPGFAYISSGTWSLVGAEVGAPVLTDAAERLNFTNEGGVNNTFRLLKNVVGLWLVQGCRRRWGIDGAEAYQELTAAAAEAEPLAVFVNPDDAAFFNPPDMVAAIEQYLVRTGQRVPATPGGIVRCVLDSLALRYRQVLDELAAVRGVPASVLHIVGGGAHNGLLCQLTADATGLGVVAGPAEATAVGNILVQAAADGAIADVAAGRALVRESFDLCHYDPADRTRWDSAYARFAGICEEDRR